MIADCGDHFSINIISAVSAQGQMYFECFAEKMESQRFITFLKKLRASADKPILTIVNRGSHHKCKTVREFLKKEGSSPGIWVILLHPSSVELNPDEQVWNNAKRHIGKISINSKIALGEVGQITLQSIQNSASLVETLFKLPDTK